RPHSASGGAEPPPLPLLLTPPTPPPPAPAAPLPVGTAPPVVVRIPPMGSHLLDVSDLAPPPAHGTRVAPLRLEGNAWFNLYVIGTACAERSRQLSLMHVK